MNLQLIKDKVDELHFPGGVKALADAVGMTVQNLHRCVRENKIQAQDLERIAKVLKVSVTIFFDEESVSIRQAGRDYREHDNSQHSGTEYHANTITVGDAELLAENKRLQAELIKAQARIIELLDK